MHSVTSREARRVLSDLLNEAEHGGEISITRRGQVVARLVPPARNSESQLPDMSEFRASIKIKKGKPTSELIGIMRDEERV